MMLENIRFNEGEETDDKENCEEDKQRLTPAVSMQGASFLQDMWLICTCENGGAGEKVPRSPNQKLNGV